MRPFGEPFDLWCSRLAWQDMRVRIGSTYTRMDPADARTVYGAEQSNYGTQKERRTLGFYVSEVRDRIALVGGDF